MEVMVMDKVVAEILVEQQPSNTLGHLSLTVAASFSIVASLSNSKSLNTQSQSLLRRRGSLATTLPSPHLEDYASGESSSKTVPIVRDFEYIVDCDSDWLLRS